jgi:predicted metal-dependent hydrolase
MKQRNYQRSPQKNLFDNAGAQASVALAATAARWRDGALIDFLGKPLCLQLNTDRRQAMREDDLLHLPLPPEATERQIQDAAESWLRREAKTLFSRLIANETQRLACGTPKFSLSFSLRGSWVQVDGQVLRLNWRLIEQPLSVIDLTLRRAVAMVPAEQASADLFSTLVL